MSTFTPDMPFTGQTLGNSRQQVLDNFASLRETISQGSGNPGVGDKPNHIDVNDSGAGKHIFVEMPVQTIGAANLPSVNEGGLITLTTNGSSELYYARDAVTTGGNTGRFQMTGPFVLNAGVPNGSVVLFGGLILKWGKVQPAGGGVGIFATPFLNNCFGVVLTSIAGTPIAGSVTAFNNTQFSFTLDGGVTGIFYIAIGN